MIRCADAQALSQAITHVTEFPVFLHAGWNQPNRGATVPVHVEVIHLHAQLKVVVEIKVAQAFSEIIRAGLDTGVFGDLFRPERRFAQLVDHALENRHVIAGGRQQAQALTERVGGQRVPDCGKRIAQRCAQRNLADDRIAGKRPRLAVLEEFAIDVRRPGALVLRHGEQGRRSKCSTGGHGTGLKQKRAAQQLDVCHVGISISAFGKGWSGKISISR